MLQALLLLAFLALSCSTTKDIQQNDSLVEFRQKHIKDLMVEDGPIKKGDDKYLSFYEIDNNYVCNCKYEFN